MRLDVEEKHRLRDLFVTQTRRCEQIPAAFGPSKHRSTQIDTEKVLQGTSDTPAALASLPTASAASRLNAARTAAVTARPHTRVLSSKAAAKHAGQNQDLFKACSSSIYETDFAAAAASRGVGAILKHSPARLSAARTTLEGSSEWADLNKLELLKTQLEAFAQHQARQQQQLQHRQQLDQQVAEHDRARQDAAAAKAAELVAAVADVAAHEQEQATKQVAAKQTADKVKQEQQQQVAAAEAARAKAAAKKAREDAALLASVERQMAAAREAAAAKAAAARAAAEEAKAANAKALQAKSLAAQEQQRRDEELMQQTIRTLQRQEEAREAALKAFHDNIAARATAAGAIAVAENKARQEREDRLISASEARAKAEAEAKHAAEVAKRVAQVADRKAAAAAAAAAKAAAQQLAMEEQARLRAQVEADLGEFNRSMELTAQQRHERNMAHKRFLEQQIVEAEERALLDDVFMSTKERELNRRLLTAARSALDSVRPA